MRIALFGTGWIMKFHARAVLEHPGAELVAAANWREESLARLAGEFSIPRTTTRWEELAEDPDVDAVVIGTPNALHAPQAIACLRAGKHVLVEKPMATGVAEADAMVEAAAGSRAFLMVAHCWRFHEDVRRMRDRVAAGEFGDVVKTRGYGVHAGWGPAGFADALRASGSEQRAAFELEAARAALDRIEVERTADDAVSVERDGGAQVLPVTDLNMFRREGDYWSVVFEGRTVRVRDLKGIRYLARLLADPGRELHVLDLVAAESGPVGGAESGRAAGLSRTGPGDAGEMLDVRAKDAYRRRLAEIEDDIEQARALEDAEREAQADTERDFLVRELSRAVGLHHRDRRAASTSERARASVTRAVRQGMARVGEHHPELGEHLDRTIRTGTYCAYVPAPRAPAAWRF